MRILFAASEAYPLIKTGGLGDVAGSLPRALLELGQDVRLILPAYATVLGQLEAPRTLAEFSEAGQSVSVVEGQMPESPLKVWLVDAPGYFDRPGNPYLDSNGQPWADNAERFALFSRMVTRLALNQAGLDWAPDIVHCNDWQTGLAPALLDLATQRPATVFTIHNLAYQGLFPEDTFHKLGLPASWWSHHALEFHNQLSFIKGGLVFADRINTVSPTYAREIQTAEFGYGLEGLLRHRSAALSGILNGIDTREWDPASDPLLEHHYDLHDLSGKQANKQVLQSIMGLPDKPVTAVIGLISRLVSQKGIDLIIEAMPDLLKLPLQFSLLGSGDRDMETRLLKLAEQYPQKLAVRIGYDETLAHRIEAGADMYLMPSRFEPCGLNQMYSLHYGTVPIVRNVGGLADTVVDTSAKTLAESRANGFIIDSDDSSALIKAVKRALRRFRDKAQWQQLQLTGMQADFSWQHSARKYLSLYLQAQHDNRKSLPDPG
ncbi:MAG TPA: glycogen synthase GlgA [Gammaproteobacteria bacterium]|nr:glycogen synthase GlgA [Gammaproteobacteria bacterium]